MMVVGSPKQNEAALLAGERVCPGCSSQLRPHGHARGRTQVLLPSALSICRADTLEAIVTALAAKAASSGYRTVATQMGRPLSMVRRWFRRVPEAHTRRLYE